MATGLHRPRKTTTAVMIAPAIATPNKRIANGSIVFSAFCCASSTRGEIPTLETLAVSFGMSTSCRVAVTWSGARCVSADRDPNGGRRMTVSPGPKFASSWT